MDGSRRRVIAKAKIISAFIATEEEVNVVQILLIVILLGEKMNPDIPMPSLETFTGGASLYKASLVAFLSLKSPPNNGEWLWMNSKRPGHAAACIT